MNNRSIKAVVIALLVACSFTPSYSQISTDLLKRGGGSVMTGFGLTQAAGGTRIVADTGNNGLATKSFVDSQLLRQQRVFNVVDYGYKADGKYFKVGAMSSGSNTLTVSGANFATSDVGKSVLVDDAGASGADLLGTITARLSSSSVTVSFTASSSVSNVNVRYGTNNTQPMQATLNAVFANGGGKIVVPRGIGYVAGPLVTSDNSGYNPNSQVYFPSTTLPYLGGPSVQPRVFLVEGEIPPSVNDAAFIDAFTEDYQGGSIIQSILPRTAVSGELPAVFGTMGLAGPYGSFNPVDVYMKNIWVRTHHDAAQGAYLSGIVLRNALNTKFDQCRTDIDISGFKSVAPTALCVGMMGVQSNGGTLNEYRSCMSVGYGLGYSIGEHTLLDNSAAFMCSVGLDVQRAGHPSRISRFLSQWNKIAVASGQIANGYPTDLHFIEPSSITIERINTGKWYDAVVDVFDENNIIHGLFYFTSSGSGTGLTYNMSKSGGTNLTVVHMQDAPGGDGGGGTPTIPNPLQVGTGSVPTGNGLSLPGEAIVNVGSATTSTLGYENAAAYYMTTNQPEVASGLVGRFVAVNTAIGASNKRVASVGFLTDGAVNTGKIDLAVMNAGTLNSIATITTTGLFIANTSTPPTPTGGGVIYVEGGALKYKGSSGTVTVIGAP